jgi:ubiquinone/menaquinone biosynthesis C-methylase UbiE
VIVGHWIKKILPEKIPSFAAVFYSALPGKMFLPYHKMIAEEVRVRENGVLLDIGTGPGILPLEIAKRFPNSKIIGIDLSEKMIEIANKNKARNKKLANLEFRVMDANALGFGDSSLDMVISTGSLHHWKRPIKILNEIYRCLKPGCEAWIYDGYGDATGADIDRCIQRLFFGFPPRRLVKRILAVHGFSQHEYDTIIKDTIAETNFKACLFEKRGIMMCLRLQRL